MSNTPTLIPPADAPPETPTEPPVPYTSWPEAEIQLINSEALMDGAYPRLGIYLDVRLYDVGVRARDMNGVVFFPIGVVAFVREPFERIDPVDTLREQLEPVEEAPKEIAGAESVDARP